MDGPGTADRAPMSALWCLDLDRDFAGDLELEAELTSARRKVDAAKVAADVKANMNAYRAKMDADKAEAQKVGINATPSFVIGTQVIAGAYPYEIFQAAIDAALK